ncbi:uncharacterized protein LOC122048862 [Zingiber officinale]|uniref:uncharacterized protein LOC122048862 n=1 Tax=Zingiber officinale TaxID=94328 RepID=UPI001C4C6CBA|nr:uncharacterized protein LOC122048862 [Zingiber officinale]
MSTKWVYEAGVSFNAIDKDSFKVMMEAVGQFGPRLGIIFLSSKESSDEAHTNQLIYEYVQQCIQQIGPENVVQIVIDNASNNMGAAKLLKEERPTIFWTTHSTNLMLESIASIPTFKKVIDQAKALTIFIYAHHKILALMRSYTKKRDIVKPGVTRFASAFLTLQCLFEKKNQLKVFAPLAKVLRIVDVDKKPSMGFVYGELLQSRKDIKNALSNVPKNYQPIIDIIDAKMKDKLDSPLHLITYLLNPFYHYKDSLLHLNQTVTIRIIDCMDVIFFGDIDMQNIILSEELPMDKKKEYLWETHCSKSIKLVVEFWCIYSFQKIAMKNLSVHTKKKNKLDTHRLNNLVFVQFNAKLMNKKNKEKERKIEVLLASDASSTQDWIVDGVDDEVEPKRA